MGRHFPSQLSNSSFSTFCVAVLTRSDRVRKGNFGLCHAAVPQTQLSIMRTWANGCTSSSLGQPWEPSRVEGLPLWHPHPEESSPSAYPDPITDYYRTARNKNPGRQRAPVRYTVPRMRCHRYEQITTVLGCAHPWAGFLGSDKQKRLGSWRI